ncbi:MAG: zinc ribbon domain-containing protein [Bacteroidales bacterium]|nr:zinc ribbon domain-containing protein [Bacteroidales bacterium]
MDNGQTRTRERLAEDSKVLTRTKDSADTGGHCPNCGVHIEPEYEICPECGWKLVNYCTFCGAPMLPGDQDCPECGMPADGVICPDCNIRNFRPFCRQCGKPLSRAARKAVEKAKQDPKVQEAARLLVRVSELQAELDGADSYEEGPSEPTESELRFREMMSKVGFTEAEKPKATKRKMGRSREEIMAEYQKALEEANKAMEEMLPPAGSTPQEQRNFYTARKVAVMEIIEEKWYGIPIQKTMGWECNKCHVLHNNPSECAVKEFGGKWITCTECKVVEEGTAGAQMYIDRIERKVYKRE